ncbi:MAG: metal ABC transporter solute-binding protein, Zn/Mn family [Alphaproteobacteria bacterium]
MSKKHTRHIFWILICALFTVLTGLTQIRADTLPNDENSNSPIKIITTTAHIGDLVRNIAGNHAEVTSLMGPGTDPHLYRPVRSDIVKLNRADMIFYNGRHLEGQMMELFDTLSNNKPVYGLAYEITNLIRDEDGAYDPHIWMDVQNWIKASDSVTEKLSAFKPEFAADFQKAAGNYKERLQKLDENIKKSIATIPPQNRVLITAHDAFGYLGSAYGIEVIGIQGLSTSSEAGLHKIESLVRRISKDKIPAIFTEASVTDQNIRAIKEGAQNNGFEVKLGGTLYSDSLGAPDTYTGTYVGMMEYNVRTITKALGGTPQNLSKISASELSAAQQ